MKSIPFYLLIVFLFISCSTNSTDTEEPDKGIFPLKVGNAWVLDLETGSQITTDTLFVRKDTLIQGQQWFELWSQESKINQHFHGFFANREDGLYRYNGEDTDILLFRRNPEVGSTRKISEIPYRIFSTFLGFDENEEFGVYTQVYIHEYHRIEAPSSEGKKYYTMDDPLQNKRIISHEIGFVYWENAYVSPVNDSTMTLNTRIKISLNEFIEAK